MSDFPYPPILEEIPLNGHAIIEASAGTGKTYTIEHLFVDRLLRAEARLEEILVVTFTDKATAELRKRVRELIERLLYWREEEGAEAQEDKQADESSTTDEVTEPAPHMWTLDEVARRRLERALFSFDRAPIYTMHGFCRRVLVDLAFDSGQLFEQELIDGQQAFRAQWRDELLRRSSVAPELRERLERWLDAGHPLPQLERLLYEAWRGGFLESNQSFELELMSLLNRTAEGWSLIDLEDAYQRAAIQSKYREEALLRLREIDELLSAPLSAIARARRIGALDLRAILRPKRTRQDKEKKKLLFPDDFPQALRQTLDRLRQLKTTIDMESALERDVVEQLLPPLAQGLREEKRRKGQLDYDDLLHSVWQALRGRQRESLLAALREQFRYALIDEFQDTDPLQWKIFRDIFAPKRVHRPGPDEVIPASEWRGLYLIGDPKQAIYTFRGADVHTYLEARQDLSERDAPRVALRTNYRSSEAMIDALNLILAQEEKSPLFSGPIQYHEPVLCGRPDRRLESEEGHPIAPVTLWRYRPPPPTKGGGALISARHLAEVYSHALAESLHQILFDEAKALWLREGESRRRLGPSDILILVRDNKEGSELLETLQRHQIPSSIYKPSGLLQGIEARELRALLAAVANPHDQGARLRAFTTPFFAVPWSQIAEYRALPPGHPKLEQLFSWHQLAIQGRYGALFYQLLYKSGLCERELFLAREERSLSNYRQLIEHLAELTSQNRYTPQELLQLFDRYLSKLESPPEDGNIQRLASDQAAVQIMTIHKSKGLEAPVIFLYGGFSRPRAGVVNVIHDPDEGRKLLVGGAATKAAAVQLSLEREQEDQRLLYVAIPRAKVKLYLPFIDSSRSLQGSYQQLKGRLRGMSEALEGRWPERLFQVEEVGTRLPVQVSDQIQDVLRLWTPPAEHLKQRDEPAARRTILSRSAPLLVTSYSRLKREGFGIKDTREISRYDEHGAHGMTREQSPLSIRALLEAAQGEKEEQLPGGREMGRCLHEVIETIDFQQLAKTQTLSEWSLSSEVEMAFTEAMRRHQIEQRWLSRLQALIYNTMRTPLHFASKRLPPLVTLKALLEMEFLYPIPEATHPPLGLYAEGEGRLNTHGQFASRWRVERGFIKGFIDALFEYEGKIYIVDWKSDQRPSYDSDALDEHVRDHYLLQAELYQLAVIRWMRIEAPEQYAQRFGGVLYVFLRAFESSPQPGEGVWFQRESWTSLCEKESALMRLLPPLGQGWS
ncbi:MAG: exodeoxyribonuclease V subunit beta [Myxococcota bacterium]|nr:exodeoxyribonuclease V subunit beta [Myxococcota bacterium]